MDPVSSIVELIKQGRELLKLRKERRQRFFSEIILPIHERFEAMRDNHLATFKHARDVLADPDSNIADLVGDVSRNEQRERQNWYLFDQLEDLGSRSRASLGPEFDEYCHELVACLIQIDGPRNSIIYYGNLSERLQGIAATYPGRTTTPEARAEAVAVVSELTDHFINYCSVVEKAYLNVRLALAV